MKIPIMISDTTLRVIDSEELDRLVRENAVLAFHRSDDWVRIGFDYNRDPNGHGSLVGRIAKHCAGRELRLSIMQPSGRGFAQRLN